MDLEADFLFSPFSPAFTTATNSFDCGNADINEFLKEDALNYQVQRLANTYVFHKSDLSIVAFFCISNDCLNQDIDNRSWNRFHRKQDIPNDKRIRQYPAIKVGRLGVDKPYQKEGIAYQLMDFIKVYSIGALRPACRLLLLDAYNQERQLRYYDRNGFKFLHDADANDTTRIMYYDLSRLQ